MIWNQTAEVSIIFMQARLTYFWVIVPNGCCCIIDLVYVPTRLICTKFYSFISVIVLHKESFYL